VNDFDDIDQQLRGAGARLHHDAPDGDAHLLAAVRQRSANQARARQARVAAIAAASVLLVGGGALAARGGGDREQSLESSSGGAAVGASATGRVEVNLTAPVGSLDGGTTTHGSIGAGVPTSLPPGTVPAPSLPEPVTSTVTRPPSTTTSRVVPPTTGPRTTTTKVPPTTGPPTTVPVGEDAVLADAMARWAANKPAAYTMEVRRSCFCVPSYTEWLRVTVVDGMITVAVFADTGLPAGADVANGLTVDEMYADAASMGPTGRVMRLEIDATFGFPIELSIDPIEMAADDEMAYSIRSFTAL
jgi:hypothetical protein